MPTRKFTYPDPELMLQRAHQWLAQLSQPCHLSPSDQIAVLAMATDSLAMASRSLRNGVKHAHWFATERAHCVCGVTMVDLDVVESDLLLLRAVGDDEVWHDPPVEGTD